MEIVANLKLNRVTKGALRYMEVGSDGKVLDYKDATVGTVYVRKSAFPNNDYPTDIRIQIQPI